MTSLPGVRATPWGTTIGARYRDITTPVINSVVEGNIVLAAGQECLLTMADDSQSVAAVI